MPDFPSPSPGLRGDSAAAASAQGLADRRELAFIAVERARMPMMVSDPRLPDNPIVLANRAFLNLTGYGADEVLGRNCRFLQGPETEPAAVDAIREAVADGRDVDVELLNYRRDRSTFWNRLHISAIRDDASRLIYFFASQSDATEQRRLADLEQAERRLLREVDHRAMNALAIVEGIVRLSRADDPAAYSAAVQRRVQAVARAHSILAERGWKDVSLLRLLETQVSPFGGSRVGLDGPEVLLPGQHVQPLALVFHEMASNAVTHGALSRDGGEVSVQWQAEPQQGLELHWRERGGPPPVADPPSGFGATMIQSIVGRQLRGRLHRTWPPEGLSVRMSIPLAKAA